VVRTHRSTTGRAISGGDVGRNSREMVGDSRGSPRGGLPVAGWPDDGCR
jgi:hypothetical protein